MSEVDVQAILQQMAELSAEVARLQAEVVRLREENEKYRRLYAQLIEENEKLRRGLRGQSAERMTGDDRQLTLGIMEALLGKKPAGGESETQTVQAHERRTIKPTGRQALPDHLGRVVIELIPPEVQEAGLANFDRIGAEVSEVLERRPASLVVVQTVRPKFVAKARVREEPTQVLVAAPAELPIERGLAGPGLLADTIVRRWRDHLPLHRLEGIYRREGVSLARSTMCGWHEALGNLARPLVAAMREDALTLPYVCTDATGVLVQAREKCRTGHFWVLVAPPRHVIFDFTAKHDMAAVDRVLAGYKGYVVADAHSVYDHLYDDSKVIEVGCWAHLRRYFYKTLGSEPELAREALGRIGALFQIEREARSLSPPRRHALRNEKSRSIVTSFFSWCKDQSVTALDDTPLAAALGYATRHRTAFERFLEDGRLPMENNRSERELRRQAVGRKNWLFVGSDEAALTNATFVSLLASCAMHAIEPWAYLRDLFCLLPSWPHRRVLELAPAFWNETRQNDYAHQRLAANPFHVAMLAYDRAHPDDK